jgi:pilus assembly protein Flp/PilA
MNMFYSKVKAFLVNEDGPTATEYAVMLALVIVAAIGVIGTLGTRVAGIFGDVNDALPGA